MGAAHGAELKLGLESKDNVWSLTPVKTSHLTDRSIS